MAKKLKPILKFNNEDEERNLIINVLQDYNTCRRITGKPIKQSYYQRDCDSN